LITTTTVVCLVRHGEVHNPRQVFYGRLPRFRLSDNGLKQAGRAGAYLKATGIDAVYSSPLLRARQTAGEIIKHCDACVLKLSGLVNEVCSSYEGCPGSFIDERQGDVYTGSDSCCEQPADVLSRTLKLIRRLRRRHSGGRVAVVTHGDVVTFTVLWAKGFAPIPENKTRLLDAGYPVAYPAYASITALTYRSGGPGEKPTVAYCRP
jgi:probable phosphoglycerate mutase